MKVKSLLVIAEPVHTETTGFNGEKGGRINLIDGSTVPIDLPSDARLQVAC